MKYTQLAPGDIDYILHNNRIYSSAIKLMTVFNDLFYEIYNYH